MLNQFNHLRCLTPWLYDNISILYTSNILLYAHPTFAVLTVLPHTYSSTREASLSVWERPLASYHSIRKILRKIGYLQLSPKPFIKFFFLIIPCTLSYSNQNLVLYPSFLGSVQAILCFDISQVCISNQLTPNQDSTCSILQVSITTATRFRDFVYSNVSTFATKELFSALNNTSLCCRL